MAAVDKFSYFVFLLYIIRCSCLDMELAETCGDKLKGCYCTRLYIDCKEAELVDISDIYPYITSDTYRIHITGGRIRSIPNNVFTTSIYDGPLNKVVYLNLSGNFIETVGKMSFQQLPNLKTLDLSENDILLSLCDEQNDLAMALAPLVNIEELYLRQVFSKEVSGGCDPGNVFVQTEMSGLTKLDFSGNYFDVMGSNLEDFMCETYNIRSLNLSRNNFELLPVSQCMTNVVDLDLSFNQIPVLHPDEIDIIDSLVNLQAMRLGGNPFSCDCFLEATFNWINVTTVPLDFSDIVCGGHTDNDVILGQPIKGLSYTDVCEGPQIVICGVPLYVSKTNYILIITAVPVVIIFTIVVTVVVCRRRRHSRRQRERRNSSEVKSRAYSRMPEA